MTSPKKNSPRIGKMQPRELSIEAYPLGERIDFFVPLYEDATGMPLKVPFIIARGEKPGPVLGISAAVHGNELNGIKIIHNVLAHLDLSKLQGSLICAPVVNVPSYNLGERYFTDGVDINDVFPGKERGTPSEQYAHAFCTTFLPACEYLIDIHTASEGRTNTLYVRADFGSDTVRKLAEISNPEIILHVESEDGTLRGAAAGRGIPAITLEAGNPAVLQDKMVDNGERAVFNVMRHLRMMSGEVELPLTPILCQSSQWLRTTGGGLLETEFELLDMVKSGQILARSFGPFGQILAEYTAPHDGVVIGMARNPASFPGTRFCHLGLLGEPKL